MMDERETGLVEIVFWTLKALAQLADLHIHHARDGKVVKAARALLPGKADLPCNQCPR